MDEDRGTDSEGQTSSAADPEIRDTAPSAGGADPAGVLNGSTAGVTDGADAAGAMDGGAAGDVGAGWVELVEQATRRRAGVALGDLVDGLGRWKTTPPLPANKAAEPAEPAELQDALGGPDASDAPVDAVGWVSAAVGSLERALVEPWWRLGDSGVREVLVAVGRLRTVLDRVEVAAVGEAVGRALPKDDGLSSVDWVVAAEGVAAPVPDLRRVSQVVTVANACRTADGVAAQDGAAGAAFGGPAGGVMPGAEVFAEAFTAGVMAVEKAGMVARFAADVKAVGDLECVAADVGLLVGAASDDGAGRALTVRELRRAIGLATRLLTPEAELERDEARQRLARSLTKTAGPTALTGAAGLSTYRLVLDAEGAAIIDTAVAALSGPVPSVDAAGVPQLDPRPAATRRADALLALVGRGVATGTRTPTPTPTSSSGGTGGGTSDTGGTGGTGRGAAFGAGGQSNGAPAGDESEGLQGPAVGDRAQVVVTIGYDQLFGAAAGAGITTSGELLSPAVVRRMACDARIIPMVLGGAGQVLDLGTSRRFFSPAQRLTIWRRDHHCSYPGCTIPAGWTEVHHTRWFGRGGPTDINNGALLCQRHHTLVHTRDLTATIDATGVTWHL